MFTQTCKKAAAGDQSKSRLTNNHERVYKNTQSISQSKKSQVVVSPSHHGSISLSDRMFQFTCATCQRHFRTSHGLKIHNSVKHRSTEPSRDVSCTQCDKKFASRGNAEKHTYTHTGENKFICNQCGKAFTQSCNLTTHMRVHTGEKPYKCTQCQLAFTTTSNLYSHVRRHHTA